MAWPRPMRTPFRYPIIHPASRLVPPHAESTGTWTCASRQPGGPGRTCAGGSDHRRTNGRRPTRSAVLARLAPGRRPRSRPTGSGPCRLAVPRPRATRLLPFCADRVATCAPERPKRTEGKSAARGTPAPASEAWARPPSPRRRPRHTTGAPACASAGTASVRGGRRRLGSVTPRRPPGSDGAKQTGRTTSQGRRRRPQDRAPVPGSSSPAPPEGGTARRAPRHG